MAFYALTNGIFKPSDKGNWTLTDQDELTASFSTTRRSMKAWPFGDGTFTVNSLEPEKTYRWIVDRYYPDRKGSVSIRGPFPFFMASDGFPCWLDHDGTFARVFIYLKPRMIQRLIDLKGDREAKSNLKAQNRAGRLVPIVKRIRDGGYEWAVYQRGAVIMINAAICETRVQAERQAQQFIDVRTKGE